MAKFILKEKPKANAKNTNAKKMLKKPNANAKKQITVVPDFLPVKERCSNAGNE